MKGSQQFNQVDPDQGQEWLDGTGKKGGEIVGITKTTAVLCRWTLSYNLQAHIAVFTLLCQANVFNVNKQAMIPERLQNMVTKDMATTQVEESLLKANSLGQEEQITFVKEDLSAKRRWASEEAPGHSA